MDPILVDDMMHIQRLAFISSIRKDPLMKLIKAWKIMLTMILTMVPILIMILIPMVLILMNSIDVKVLNLVIKYPLQNMQKKQNLIVMLPMLDTESDENIKVHESFIEKLKNIRTICFYPIFKKIFNVISAHKLKFFQLLLLHAL
ncbi:uncharacterized protein LOC105427778 isoform X1 [Pogonomyrmex barbatus]|uniref:Uncharacterized protein LOC105427778 isoform X1 n=1 Tax=Pogonomyrmex barbatus TaxID=144034 RepID=A0A6I9WBB4_9HYME|nr:uncharacterized protein LOC105427778 isoform X1 [Pogonomyrmex barbatus]XP_011637982.1 uncharacterized protein LOC105427778 isoform X1 [Pogonomyrmex barbatus]XP_011637983.1 uncharacterized protein LOC105427778 isoform X1 [Pogonomyrmex barbatus]XP_011637984.1 uncharacterized protein LOC105427778 isoform X1 [Pogonomyrmex barbatus]XP_011637985.1 uncharacterized protein LOC105427778 isoform X1 [Pogonomyrmex barbatus]XP_011637986.1 uncharacterized protein LOC105427778 isoform X1 [Pogonomyrmex bar